MKVRRLGRVWSADDGPAWMASHAAYPTPVAISSERIRVFFNTRDGEGRGQLAWVDVDARDPRRVLDVCDAPGLPLADTGTFDDRGISNGSVHRIDGRLWLYYMGWNKAADVPFRNAIGLAVSEDSDGNAFRRRFEGPLIDRSRFDAFTLSYPFVVPGQQGQPWRMYYGTSRAGGVDESKMEHVLTDAVSSDGEDWRPTGRDLIGLEPGDYGLSRPWLATLSGVSSMLYSIRRQRYTIGLSQLDEASGEWRRVDSDVMGPGADDWETEASCYPAVIDVPAGRFLFYCGNGYGRTGFGVAVLED